MAETIELEGGSFSGLLLDNEANDDRQGSGFNPLCHRGHGRPGTSSGTTPSGSTSSTS